MSEYVRRFYLSLPLSQCTALGCQVYCLLKPLSALLCTCSQVNQCNQVGSQQVKLSLQSVKLSQ